MSESSAALAAADLLAWNDANAKIWYSLATEHPEVLDIVCDIHKAKTVVDLLHHIVAAELRYAERLSDAPVTDFSAIASGTAAEIFATHDRAVAMLRRMIADEGFDWGGEIVFTTLTAGKRRATRRAILHHALLHGTRHYAQLATLTRQHGFKAAPADFLITNSSVVE